MEETKRVFHAIVGLIFDENKIQKDILFFFDYQFFNARLMWNVSKIIILFNFFLNVELLIVSFKEESN